MVESKMFIVPIFKAEDTTTMSIALYPTAMLRPMPVWDPTLVDLTPEQFLQGIFFFGYVGATVRTPITE